MSQFQSPVTRIFNLVKLESKEITSVYFFAILNGLIQLSLPLGVQAIIGFVLGGFFSTSLVILISLVVLGVLLMGLLQVNQMKIIEKIQQKIFFRYTFQIAERIPAIDAKKTDSIYLPELVNRFFDISTLQKGLTKLLLEIPTASIQILFGLLLLTFYHPAFIVFGVILIFILWLILYYTGSRGLSTSIAESTNKYETASWLEEMARMIHSFKFSKNTTFYIGKTDDRVNEYLQARNSHFKVLLQQFFTLIGFKVVITAAMLIVGSLLLVNQQLNIGQFIAAEIVIILVINSVEKLIGNLDNVYDVLTAVDKISKLTDLPVEKKGQLNFEPHTSGISVEVKNLSFGYSDQRKILHNINFSASPGEKIAITGEDGTGKSTLLKLLTGSFTDFEGNILINGIPIANYNPDTVRAHSGIFLGQQDIFHGTILENITMGSSVYSIKRIGMLAEKTGLSTYLSMLPSGLDTFLDPTGSRLPRNVIHKILLTRALLNRPALLLLEEPWSRLDESNKEQIQNLLLYGSEKTTVLVVTNDESFIKSCDKVLKLTKDGESVLSMNQKNK